MFAGVDYKKWPNVTAWLKRINDRSAVQRGLNVPKEPMATNDVIEKKLADDAEYKKSYDDLQQHLDKAKEQYGYKYSAP